MVKLKPLDCNKWFWFEPPAKVVVLVLVLNCQASGGFLQGFFSFIAARVYELTCGASYLLVRI